LEEKTCQSFLSRLPAERRQHSLRVAEVAVKLADRYGADPDKARLAGLFHDYARDLPEDLLLRLAQEAGLMVGEIEKCHPVLLHGRVGAFLLRKELGLEDPEVLQAIARHSTGATSMGLLDKIIYLADLIEPGRNFPGVEELRSLAFEDLDAALLKALDSAIIYIIEKGWPLHPDTVYARNELILKKGGGNHSGAFPGGRVGG